MGARKEDNSEVKEVGSGWVKRGWNDGQWAKRLTKPRAKKDKMHPMDPEDVLRLDSEDTIGRLRFQFHSCSLLGLLFQKISSLAF